MKRTLAYIAVAITLAGTSAANGCDNTPEPKPSDSTLCGVRPDQLIYCYPSPTVSGMDPQ